MLEISLSYAAPEVDVPGLFVAQWGNVQGTGASPADALADLSDKLTRRFPRPIPSGNLFVEGN